MFKKLWCSDFLAPVNLVVNNFKIKNPFIILFSQFWIQDEILKFYHAKSFFGQIHKALWQSLGSIEVFKLPEDFGRHVFAGMCVEKSSDNHLSIWLLGSAISGRSLSVVWILLLLWIISKYLKDVFKVLDSFSISLIFVSMEIWFLNHILRIFLLLDNRFLSVSFLLFICAEINNIKNLFISYLFLW